MTDKSQTSSIDTIVDDFSFLDEWEDRYRYVIELGRTLEPLTEAEHCPANKVEGCASQVWLVTSSSGGEDPVLTFRGDSDAHIVRGLIAILLALYSGRKASEIVSTDPADTFDRLGLREHLTRQRSNGLTAMVERVRQEAASAKGSQPALN
ncbi:SufE family protein [Microbaculum marinum]|uniref:SufE family protein n=1 Tax=Microbaculum marinum TaxID=1764581 RepID=A0AAW9RLZ1_9HYPH